MAKSSSTVKPFDIPFTPFHNYVLDHIMPNLSPNSWKVLCVAIRSTLGWIDKNSDTGRKVWDEISYRQFLQKTGIGSMQTLTKAIKECLEIGYLIRTKTRNHPGTGKPIYAYCLNLDYEVATTETVAGATTETVAGATTETVATKQTKKQNKEVDVVQQHLINTLINFGITENIATELATERTEAQIFDWLEYTQAAHNLRDPVGFLVAKLRSGERIPKKKDRDRHRYTTGKYADLIQH